VNTELAAVHAVIKLRSAGIGKGGVAVNMINWRWSGFLNYCDYYTIPPQYRKNYIL